MRKAQGKRSMSGIPIARFAIGEEGEGCGESDMTIQRVTSVTLASLPMSRQALAPARAEATAEGGAPGVPG